MASWRATVSEPAFRFLIALSAVYVVLVLTAPQVVAWLTTTEGPIEQVSHLVLLACAASWAVLFRRTSKTERVVAALGLAYTTFLLLEEIDYGGIYGVNLGYRLLQHLTGSNSLHSLGPAERPSPFADPQVLISLPAVFYFLGGILPSGTGIWKRMGRLAPRRSEATTFFVALSSPFVIAGVVTALDLDPDDPRFEIMGAYQTVIYTLMMTVALRARRQIEGEEIAPGDGE